MNDEDAIRVAVVPRQNSDQRSYKVVMNVAGDTRDFAIVPKELAAVAERLVAALEMQSQPDYVVGFAPGGIPLALAVTQELGVSAVISYKTRLGLPGELTWSEPHALFNTFYFYGAACGDRVLLVDDEVDSGNTIAGAVTALRERGVEIVGVASAVEVLHGGRSLGRERLVELRLDLVSLRRVEVDAPVDQTSGGRRARI